MTVTTTTTDTPGDITLTDYWREMVTVALLGTDRRDPPLPPTGGLADLAADDPQPTPSQRLLQQVSGCAVAQRAGVLPGASAQLIAPPDDDPRPMTPPVATATWRRIVGDWPVLEDEWVLAVIHSGRRLAPELVVPLLARHRTDAIRHARVLVAAGPLGQWMIEWSPRLACTAKNRTVMEAIGELPELAIVPDLLPVLLATPRAGRAHDCRRSVVGRVRRQSSGRADQSWWPASIPPRCPRWGRRSATSTPRCRPSAWRSPSPTSPGCGIRC